MALFVQLSCDRLTINCPWLACLLACRKRCVKLDTEIQQKTKIELVLGRDFHLLATFLFLNVKTNAGGARRTVSNIALFAVDQQLSGPKRLQASVSQMFLEAAAPRFLSRCRYLECVSSRPSLKSVGPVKQPSLFQLRSRRLRARRRS